MPDKNPPDGVVTKGECATIRINLERRLTRVEIMASTQIVLLIITLWKLFTG